MGKKKKKERETGARGAAIQRNKDGGEAESASRIRDVCEERIKVECDCGGGASLLSVYAGL